MRAWVVPLKVDAMRFKSRQAHSTEPCGLSFSQLDKLSDEVLMAHMKGGHGDALAVFFYR
jgi:hypothetical protein